MPGSHILSMDPYFLFGSTAGELLAVLISGSVAAAAGLAFGAVYVVRFFRLKSKRSLFLGLALIFLTPLLAYLALCLDAWLIEKRVGPEMVNPELAQEHARN